MNLDANYYLSKEAFTGLKPTVDNASTGPTFQYNPEEAQILFFNLSISKASKKDKTQVVLVETIVSKGKIKRDYPKSSPVKAFQLRCSFLDDQKNVLKQTTINHPLYRRYEYQDDEGQMQSKVVESNEGQFSLRTQLTEGIVYLQVEEILEDNQPIQLQTLKL